MEYSVSTHVVVNGKEVVEVESSSQGSGKKDNKKQTKDNSSQVKNHDKRSNDDDSAANDAGNSDKSDVSNPLELYKSRHNDAK
jgi:hypothetical protein